MNVQAEREDGGEQNLAGDVDVIVAVHPVGQRDQRQKPAATANAARLMRSSWHEPAEQALRPQQQHQQHGQEQHEIGKLRQQRLAEIIDEADDDAADQTPSRLPEPPRMTTTSASGSMSWSRPG